MISVRSPEPISNYISPIISALFLCTVRMTSGVRLCLEIIVIYLVSSGGEDRFLKCFRVPNAIPNNYSIHKLRRCALKLDKIIASLFQTFYELNIYFA